MFEKSYYSHMKKASITEAKNGLSALIDRVKNGTPILIVDRGRPVARLEPVTEGGATGDERLARLTRDGVVRPARGPGAGALVTSEPPAQSSGTSALQALLDERRAGR